MKRTHIKLEKYPFFGIFIIVLVVASIYAGFRYGNNFQILSRRGDTVSTRDLQSMLKDKKFTLINVHTPYEGEIEKTDTFIEYDQIIASSFLMPKDKNVLIILYCKTGRMSAEALETMKNMGYSNVRHLAGGMDAWGKSGGKLTDLSNLENEVLPQEGIELPVAWGDIGPKLISIGVIDEAKFRQAVKLTSEQEVILTKGSYANIRIDRSNAQFIVDMLWALGLAQKSIVYTQGPLGKEYKNEVGNFASTGGWTLARGEALSYLNRFDLIPLTSEQQARVAEISKNVYRPCCGNPTWFPDCNHGMAALAIIELLVANDVDEQIIYKKLLGNSFWFGDSYLYIATDFARQGIAWADVDAKTILGREFSSGQGAGAIAKRVGRLPWRQAAAGGSCGA